MDKVQQETSSWRDQKGTNSVLKTYMNRIGKPTGKIAQQMIGIELTMNQALLHGNALVLNFNVCASF